MVCSGRINNYFPLFCNYIYHHNIRKTEVITAVDRGRTTTQNNNCKRVYGSAAGKSLESAYLWYEKKESYLQ
jgi:hypothetical protein